MRLTKHSKRFQRLLYPAILITFFGCTSEKINYNHTPAWIESDREHISVPKENAENQLWDIIEHDGFYEIGKVLDIGWVSRKIGYNLGIVGSREADNLNSLDDNPNSTWFTHRHGKNRMSVEELMRGPNSTDGPDSSGVITIIKGKFEGVSIGFIIIDSKGDKYFLKFDGPGFYEMSTSAEVISTKFFHSAGYNVPENHIFYFKYSQLKIGPEAVVPTADKRERKMTMEDIEKMLSSQSRNSEGKIRSVASKWLTGSPIGPFQFHGRRADDPNDSVDHEHRRELRGLRVLSSWLGDTDRRMANTLDMYITDEKNRKYIKHYLIDMGSTLGSGWDHPHSPRNGNEYDFDFENVAKAFLMLGMYEEPWDSLDSLNYTSIGMIESEVFDPKSWVGMYPNPASENMTYRDAYWGAKIVMNFSDEDIEAIVKTGEISDPEAAAYLTRILIERRDKVVSYWFSKINPLDEFKVSKDSSNNFIFTFTDMALKAGVAEKRNNRYTVRVKNEQDKSERVINLVDASDFLLEKSVRANAKHPNYEIEIKTTRETSGASKKKVRIHVAYRERKNGYEVIAIERD